MTKAKICGLTNYGDARLAVELGADFLGFIFAKSPRQLISKKAVGIIDRLPSDVKKVGVFANQDIDEVKRISREVDLDYLQLHGNESPEYCKKIELPVIKAFRVKDESSLEKVKKYKDVDKYLFDTYHPDKLGGVGETFNWELARKDKSCGQIIIAGGLDETNVQEAIKIIKPYGVDVSSGIEVKPGVKDQKKLKEFVKAVK